MKFLVRLLAIALSVAILSDRTSLNAFTGFQAPLLSAPLDIACLRLQAIPPQDIPFEHDPQMAPPKTIAELGNIHGKRNIAPSAVTWTFILGIFGILSSLYGYQLIQHSQNIVLDLAWFLLVLSSY